MSETDRSAERDRPGEAMKIPSTGLVSTFDFADILSARMGVPIEQVCAVLKEIPPALQAIFKSGGQVVVVNDLGRFELRTFADREGYIPATGERRSMPGGSFMRLRVDRDFLK